MSTGMLGPSCWRRRLLGVLGLLVVALCLTAVKPAKAAAASWQWCWFPTSAWPCSFGSMAGTSGADTGWIGNWTWDPSMDNQSTGTAKRLEAYVNGQGLVGAWNRDPTSDTTWTVPYTGPTGGGNDYHCQNRSTGTVNVKCWNWWGS